jgi:outer membrane protein assembly factor BamE
MADHIAKPLPMPDFTSLPTTPSHRTGALLAVLALAGALTACSAVDGSTNRVVNAFTPYRIDVVQGNVVTREQVAVLRPGMSRLQVRDVLGTPLLASLFHADRWDYVFTFVRQGQAPQSRKVAVFFKGDVLERFEADTLPSEAEFVASLDAGVKRKAALLEASSDKLEKFPAPAKAVTPESVKSLPPLPTTYPPLESPQR